MEKRSMAIEADGSLEVAELRALFAHAPWARERSEAALNKMLQGTLCFFTARRDGLLVGFVRAWGDGVFRAMIDDLVVLPEERGQGLGGALLKRMLERLEGVEEVALSCDKSMAAYYEPFGFELTRGAHMKRKPQLPDLNKSPES